MLNKLAHSDFSIIFRTNPRFWAFKPFFRRVSPYADEDWMYTDSYRRYEAGFLMFRVIFFYDDSYFPEVY